MDSSVVYIAYIAYSGLVVLLILLHSYYYLYSIPLQLADRVVSTVLSCVPATRVSKATYIYIHTYMGIAHSYRHPINRRVTIQMMWSYFRFFFK